MQQVTLLKGVFFLNSEPGLVYLGRHAVHVWGSNLRRGCRGCGDGDGGVVRDPVISDSIWTWESKFEEIRNFITIIP